MSVRPPQNSNESEIRQLGSPCLPNSLSPFLAVLHSHKHIASASTGPLTLIMHYIATFFILRSGSLALSYFESSVKAFFHSLKKKHNACCELNQILRLTNRRVNLKQTKVALNPSWHLTCIYLYGQRVQIVQRTSMQS